MTDEKEHSDTLPTDAAARVAALVAELRDANDAFEMRSDEALSRIGAAVHEIESEFTDAERTFHEQGKRISAELHKEAARLGSDSEDIEKSEAMEIRE